VNNDFYRIYKEHAKHLPVGQKMILEKIAKELNLTPKMLIKKIGKEMKKDD